MKSKTSPHLLRRIAFGALLTVAACGTVAEAAETADLPAAFPADRYVPMKKSSPFALATAAAPKDEAKFSRDMFLTGRASIGGREMISITKQDTKQTFTLVAGEPPVNGMSLVEVRSSPVVGKTTALVKMGNDTAELQFNEMTIRAPAAITNLPAQTARPNVPTVTAPQSNRGERSSGGGSSDSNRQPRRIIRRPSS